MYVFSVNREGIYNLLMIFYVFVFVNKIFIFFKKYKNFFVWISLEEILSYIIIKYFILFGKLFWRI